MKPTEGRYIGGVHDTSAPTEIPVILLKAIIGGVHDTSAPTDTWIHAFNTINNLLCLHP